MKWSIGDLFLADLQRGRGITFDMRHRRLLSGRGGGNPPLPRNNVWRLSLEFHGICLQEMYLGALPPSLRNNIFIAKTLPILPGFKIRIARLIAREPRKSQKEGQAHPETLKPARNPSHFAF